MPKWSNDRIFQAIEADTKKLKALTELQADIKAQIAELESKVDPGDEEALALDTKHTALVSKALALHQEENETWGRISDTLIAAYDGDYAAIMTDAKEHLQECSKENYLNDCIRPLADLRKKHPGMFNGPLYKRGYYSYKNYLLSAVNTQVKALERFNLSKDELETLVEEQASSTYKKPKAKQQCKRESTDPALLPIVSIPDSLEDYMPIPANPHIRTYFDILSAGKAHIDEMPERQKKINRNISCDVLPDGDKRLIRLQGGKENTSFIVDDVNLLPGRKTKTAEALSIRTFSAILDQAVRDGELIQPSVSFPVQSLGDYGSLRAASKAVKDIAPALLSIIWYKEEQKPNGAIDFVAAPILSSITCKNGLCTVNMSQDPNLDWKAITKYRTYLPGFLLKLNAPKVARLGYLIADRCRQSTRDIKNQGYCVITMQYLHSKLFLKDPKNTNDGARDIVDAILTPLEALETEYAKKARSLTENTGIKHEPDLKFELLPKDPSYTPREFLAQVKLKVIPSGSYRDFLIDIADKEDGHRRTEERKYERRISAAAEGRERARLKEAKKTPAIDAPKAP